MAIIIIINIYIYLNFARVYKLTVSIHSEVFTYVHIYTYIYDILISATFRICRTALNFYFKLETLRRAEFSPLLLIQLNINFFANHTSVARMFILTLREFVLRTKKDCWNKQNFLTE